MNEQKQPKQDFLKYWRVVRFWVKEKYGIGQQDLELLLFLYSERYFKKSDFDEYAEIVSWEKRRFQRLITQGWIVKFREHRYSLNEGAIYQLSHKAKGVIKNIYQKLLGEEGFSVDVRRSPLGKKDLSYMQKVYRNAMVKINKEYKEMKRKRLNP
jgi:hypothetical protein|tara:strand:- start:1086 stop:1550 length:465 start_codon:yes stop_codon:yes gene_type:complete